MQDGRLTVNFEDGRITGVSVSAALDEAYRRMFESARLKAEEPTAAIESGISVVIFGCFWLEAVCNSNLEQLLNKVVSLPSVGPVLWKVIERQSIPEKLELLLSFSSRNYHEALTNLKEAFRLRNRLAHFKDERTAVESAIEATEFICKFPDFPEHDLILELRSPKIEKHANAILEGRSMLDQIVAEYIRVIEDGDGEILLAT